MSEKPTYPDDVQKALDRAAEVGWSVECYQAALSIALSHLVQDPPLLEVVVMWAEEDITYETVGFGLVNGIWTAKAPAERTIKAGTFYLVCPACYERTEPVVWEDGTEYRKTYFDEIVEPDQGEGPITYQIGDNTDWACDDWGLLCEECTTRLAVPSFLEADYT